MFLLVLFISDYVLCYFCKASDCKVSLNIEKVKCYVTKVMMILEDPHLTVLKVATQHAKNTKMEIRPNSNGIDVGHIWHIYGTAGPLLALAIWM